MSKTLLGDVCAHIPGPAGAKGKYPRCGTAFVDDKDGRISIKLDSLPLAGGGWIGWMNIFPRKAAGERPIGDDTSKFSTGPQASFGDDDIPF